VYEDISTVTQHNTAQHLMQPYPSIKSKTDKTDKLTHKTDGVAQDGTCLILGNDMLSHLRKLRKHTAKAIPAQNGTYYRPPDYSSFYTLLRLIDVSIHINVVCIYCHIQAQNFRSKVRQIL